jgi:hypothetical protein
MGITNIIWLSHWFTPLGEFLIYSHMKLYCCYYQPLFTLIVLYFILYEKQVAKKT